VPRDTLAKGERLPTKLLLIILKLCAPHPTLVLKSKAHTPWVRVNAFVPHSSSPQLSRWGLGELRCERTHEPDTKAARAHSCLGCFMQLGWRARCCSLFSLHPTSSSLSTAAAQWHRHRTRGEFGVASCWSSAALSLARCQRQSCGEKENLVDLQTAGLAGAGVVAGLAAGSAAAAGAAWLHLGAAHAALVDPLQAKGLLTTRASSGQAHGLEGQEHGERSATVWPHAPPS
jgi:hypothetical protein